MSARNVLFIMCDQLRADHLSAYGHPHLHTPHIDRLAAMGTRFTHCYAQAAVCGPSRMSFYTGRYVASHGATWNFVPLRVGEPTLGDHLRAAGVRTAVVGKTHAVADVDGLIRLGMRGRDDARLTAEAGFEPYARHDGVVALDDSDDACGAYQTHLRAAGYAGRNPWHDFANSGLHADGTLASGWQLRHARLPARVHEANSETAWATERAMDFIDAQGRAPWCLHLSYIKPHWPYVAPAPYHALYGPDDCLPPQRADHERDDTHPVYRAFREHPEGLAFSRDDVRNTVMPTYMGLIKQIDDHVGRLLEFLQQRGRLRDTLIVFTSDHGDLLGDHWLGEKELFFEPSVRVPLIIVDPSPGAVPGRRCNELVEAIDVVPTILDALDLTLPEHWLEGHSLQPCLRGIGAPLRDAVFSELDLAFYDGGRHAGRAVMVRTDDWKLVHYDGLPAQLYDLRNDPAEVRDLASDPARRRIADELRLRVFDWMRARKTRVTLSREAALSLGRQTRQGVAIGRW
jgi:arylsulfatase A-like enzyme